MLRRIAIGLVLALLVALPATAQDFEKGMQAHKRGDYATAFKNWRPLAAKGIVAAQFNLGLMYAQSQGVPRDYGKAVEWYRKAAEQGLARAQHNLGVSYDSGRGVPRDYAEAVNWYRKAAEQGLYQAQYNLGGMYAEGQGVPQDYILAHMWYSLAATSGHPYAKGERDRAAEEMNAAQIAEAQKLAGEWWAKHRKN